jgi:hypothetical protein
MQQNQRAEKHQQQDGQNSDEHRERKGSLLDRRKLCDKSRRHDLPPGGGGGALAPSGAIGAFAASGDGAADGGEGFMGGGALPGAGATAGGGIPGGTLGGLCIGTIGAALSRFDCGGGFGALVGIDGGMDSAGAFSVIATAIGGGGAIGFNCAPKSKISPGPG